MEIINVSDQIIEVNVTNDIVVIQAQTGAYPLPSKVYSVFGRTGNVVALEGDYTLDQLSGVTIAAPTSGQVLKYNGSAWVNSTEDNPVTSVFGRTGAVTAQTGDYNTDQVGEGLINQYYTNARSRAAISENITGMEYSSASGIFSLTSGYVIPTQVMLDAKADDSTTITIDGVTQNIEANRTWQILPLDGTTGQILAKASNTNYDTTWIDNYTSVLKHEVKAGEAISKGQAVYVSSADGTNMIISKSSNATEATSSKTLGLLAQDLALNGKGFVITEGLLAGLNTNGANAGDPVWLGTGGNLIFGLANKPSAPSHLVFIGVVTRVNTNNGEIFVKVQNGFEMGELHDYAASGVANNDVITYESSTSLYKPKSISTILGYTPVTSGRTISTTAPLTGGGDLSANRTLAITQAGASADGYLSSTNWNTFNNKQAALSGTGFVKSTAGVISYDTNTYLTTISGITAGGELSGTYANPSLLNSAVIGKVLTGLNLTGGGSIAATDSILSAFGKIQNQISAMVGGVLYQGTWNASTNLPAITSSVGTKGNYYIISVAGSTNINGINDWKVGDWIIFDGSTWGKVDNTDTVSSVNGYTGAVSLVTSDIAESGNLYFTNGRAIGSTLTGYVSGSGTITSSDSILGAIQKLNGNINNIVSGVSSVFGRTGAVTAQSGDYTTTQVTEGTNLYYTDGRSRGAISLTTSGSSGASTYNNTTGVLNVPTYTISGLGGLPLTGGTLTGDLTLANPSANTKLFINRASSSYTSGVFYQTNGTYDFLIGQNPLSTGTSDYSIYNYGTSSVVFNIARSTGAATFSSSVTAGDLISTSYGSARIQVTSTTNSANSGLRYGAKDSTGTTKNAGIYYVAGTTTATTFLSMAADDNNYQFNVLANGNVGIGTNTPTGPLQINKDGVTEYSTVRVTNANSTADAFLGVGGSGVANINLRNNAYVWTSANTNFVFGTNDTEKMRITSAGNVGIGGTVPNTWNSIFRVLEIGNLNSSIYARTDGYDQLFLGTNHYYSTGGAYLYANTGKPAQRFYLYNGDFTFQNAPSGTAGNAITWATPMTLTAAGNLGIGTTSPVAIGSGYIGLSIAGDNTSGRGGYLSIMRSTQETFRIISNSSETGLYSTENVPIYFGTNSTERMRITSGGNVGIGTTSPGKPLEISYPGVGFRLRYNSNNYMDFESDFMNQVSTGANSWQFQFNGTPAMQFNSNGNVLIGTTTDNGIKFQVNGAVASYGSSGQLIFQNQASSNTYVWFANNSGAYLYNSSVGNIGVFGPSTGLYTALSDSSKKKDFEASMIGLEAILNLKPTLYRMKSDDENTNKQLGFIAQEVKPFIPQAYVENGEGEDKFIGLQDRPIIAVLVKGMQEQQVIIETLKSRLNQLESK